jgi:hypothetical protein
MRNGLIGLTGQSFLDVWTIAHLAFWTFIGSALWPMKIPLRTALLACVSVAFAWEVFERFAEKKWPHIWLSPESWLNAYVSDPLTAVVGVAGMYYALNHWR